MTDLQKIFLLSRVNGADNCQELLPVNGWTWPTGTFLQTRLEQLKKEQGDE